MRRLRGPRGERPVRRLRVGLFLWLAGACAPRDLEVQQLGGEAMGTTWQVRWRGPVPTASEAEDRILDVLQRVDAAMSSWRDDSEISKIRGGEGPVSEETYAVVSDALQIAAATDGAFDPTVEPLMTLWGFRGGDPSTPTDAQITEILGRVGWDRIRLERRDGVPWIVSGGTSLDLSAIAKGHAVDQVSLAVSALGAVDHLVEIGGEVRAHGRGPAGAWRVGVDRPDAGGRPGEDLVAIATLSNMALATSGNYRNTRQVDGRAVVHTMDPRLGRPYDSPVLSATVVAPTCRGADGWATALMVLDVDAGLAAIEARPAMDAMILVGGPDGVESRRTSGLGAWLPPR